MNKLVLSFFLASTSAWAGNFFTDTTVDHFQLKAPFAKILQMKKSGTNFLDIKNQKFDGELTYSIHKVETKLAVEMNIKGFSSVTGCDFPKLELKIKKGQTSIFEENKKIDLNTHCDDLETIPGQFAIFQTMFHAHREVVTYRILESLGLVSYQTKPVFMNYVDSDTGKAPTAALKEKYQAFFIEDKSIFIKRNSVTEILASDDPFKNIDLAKGKTIETQYQFTAITDHSTKFDLMTLAKIELFENLVLNRDWFIKASPADVREENPRDRIWNIKLFETKDQRWMVVPQDFNLAIISLIDFSSPFSAEVTPTVKFIAQLSEPQKLELKNLIVSKREEILSHLQLVQNDPSFEKIKTFLELRLENMIRYLNTEK